MKISNISFTGIPLPQQSAETLQKVLIEMRKETRSHRVLGNKGSIDHLNTLREIKDGYYHGELRVHPNHDQKIKHGITSIDLNGNKITIDTVTNEIEEIGGNGFGFGKKMFDDIAEFLETLLKNFNNPQKVKKEFVNTVKTLKQ